MDVDDGDQDLSPKSQKTPVVRGARACTVCRTAKMKCVSTDGQSRCARCQKSDSECIFEKHRRGRKPGSKLSEASKMLRRLEKGLNNAKLKSHVADPALAQPDLKNGDSQASQTRLARLDRSLTHADTLSYPPSSLRDREGSVFPSQLSGSSSMDEDENDDHALEENMYPARLITRESKRNSFFGTVLGPTGSRNPKEGHAASSLSPTSSVRPGFIPGTNDSLTYSTASDPPLGDPIQMGLMDEKLAYDIFELVLIRLNPFVNLFDYELHSAEYVRRRCSFLFTSLLMAGSKFFKSELYPRCRQLAEKHAVRAFAEQLKSVEVVQAFMCMTYWKEPEDTRTWTYIGYACRMAVELGLNHYLPSPPENETETQRLERRNRERTYLVLFVHDRSLSMQTGRLYMLPEDEFAKEAETWHEQQGPQPSAMRPEDVILSAFVSLRIIATETTKMFELQRGAASNGQADNYDFLLNVCNSKLNDWMLHWANQMKRARGEPFHHSFLEFFELYVGLFLNSFGIQAFMSTGNPNPSLQASTTCYNNAMRCLQIIVKEFARVQMLQYSQESITTMTAYCAVMLLKLLRKFGRRDEATSKVVLALILQVSDVYKEAGTMMPSSFSFVAHSRFLRLLVQREEVRARHGSRGDANHSSSRSTLRLGPYPTPSQSSTSPVVDRHPHTNGTTDVTETAYRYPTYGQPPQQVAPLSSPEVDHHSGMVAGAPPYPPPFTEQTPADHAYYNNMCRELGVDLIHETGNIYSAGLPQHPYPMMGA